MDSIQEKTPSAGGYISEEAKRKFTLTAGILGGVFFILQFVLPFMAFIPAIKLPETIKEGPLFNFKPPVYFNKKVWFIKVSIDKKNNNGSISELWYISESEPDKPVKYKGFNRIWEELVSDENGLWLISKDAAAILTIDGEYREYISEKNIANINNSFILNGRPAIVNYNKGMFIIKRFGDNGWERINEFEIINPDRPDYCPKCLTIKVLNINEQLHLFTEIDDTIYYREGFPKGEEDDIKNNWEKVAVVKDDWHIVNIAGKLAIFYWETNGFRSVFTGLIREGDKWSKFFSVDTKNVFGFYYSVIGSNALKEPLFFYIHFPAEIKIVKASEIGRESSKKFSFFKSMFPKYLFPGFFVFIQLIPYILQIVLALILTIMMKKYRVSNYNYGSKSAHFATIWKRAWSQIIDIIIYLIPLLAIMGEYISKTFFSGEFPDSLEFFKDVLLVFLYSSIWSVIYLLLFSYTEGKYGYTPGKWLLRIKVVGEDLLVCGFKRAFVRNLLKLVDGFFSFLVGILLAALSEKWQRLGDMAAHTIVINVKKRESSATAE